MYVSCYSKNYEMLQFSCFASDLQQTFTKSVNICEQKGYKNLNFEVGRELLSVEKNNKIQEPSFKNSVNDYETSFRIFHQMLVFIRIYRVHPVPILI